MITDLYNYVASLPVDHKGRDYMTKTASLLDVLKALPDPQVGANRDLSQVPDADIYLTLSTTPKHPDHIQQKIARSENAYHFTDDILAGLCLSGQGYPIQIYLHEYLLKEVDPSGVHFDEVFWHELVHATEGISTVPLGAVTREKPWSYQLQEAMLAQDRKIKHVWFPDELEESGLSKVRLHYLRAGTSLQDNVSEVFARAAVLYWYHIRETGVAPSDFVSLMGFNQDNSKISPIFNDPNAYASRNRDTLIFTFASFSESAMDIFVPASREIIPRIARLYGCVPETI